MNKIAQNIWIVILVNFLVMVGMTLACPERVLTYQFIVIGVFGIFEIVYAVWKGKMFGVEIKQNIKEASK